MNKQNSRGAFAIELILCRLAECGAEISVGGIMEKTIISAKNVAVEKTSEEDDTAVRAAVIFA